MTATKPRHEHHCFPLFVAGRVIATCRLHYGTTLTFDYSRPVPR